MFFKEPVEYTILSVHSVPGLLKDYTLRTIHYFIGDLIASVSARAIVNGKLVEGWFVTDSTDMFKQLGALEYTEKGKNLFPEDVK